jgi:hypothetical protein
VKWRPNSRATFTDDAQMRVGKQLLAAKKPNRKRLSDSLTRINFLFLMRSDEVGVVGDEDDDDG